MKGELTGDWRTNLKRALKTFSLGSYYSFLEAVLRDAGWDQDSDQDLSLAFRIQRWAHLSGALTDDKVRAGLHSPFLAPMRDVIRDAAAEQHLLHIMLRHSELLPNKSTRQGLPILHELASDQDAV